jgi:hypothetical protein
MVYLGLLNQEDSMGRHIAQIREARNIKFGMESSKK